MISGPARSDLVVRAPPPPPPPYRLDLTAWTLRRRRRNEIERWDGAYQRALLVGDLAAPVRVEQLDTALRPVLRVEIVGPDGCSATEIAAVRSQVIRLLGVDVDLAAFYELAGADPLTRPLKSRFLGMRPHGSPACSRPSSTR